MRNGAAAGQVELGFKGRGGARKGAGRPKKEGAGPSHARRPLICGRHPIHVSLKLCDDVLRLRSRRCFSIVCGALAASCNREGFRVVACSVQGSHLHLMIEASDARALARGMQSVEIRIAQGINRLMGRKGKVFAERYFVHVLATPTEVRLRHGWRRANGESPGPPVDAAASRTPPTSVEPRAERSSAASDRRCTGRRARALLLPFPEAA